MTYRQRIAEHAARRRYGGALATLDVDTSSIGGCKRQPLRDALSCLPAG